MLEKVTVREVEIVIEPDENPDLSHLGEFSRTPREGAIKQSQRPGMYTYFNPCNPERGQEDYKRMKAYERDEWHMVGVFAKATIEVHTKDGDILQTITSGGLWGIESDSDPDYIEQEVGYEEYCKLIRILDALGIPEEAVPAWEDVDPSKHRE